MYRRNAQFYMQRALMLAQLARDKGEVPVGAVIVDSISGRVIAESHNQCEVMSNPLLHAEMVAITEACRIQKSKILGACHIYITLEPCLMCATAISYARIARIYYGASDAKFGAIESGPRIFCGQSSLYKPDIYSGILEQETKLLIKEFFQGLR